MTNATMETETTLPSNQGNQSQERQNRTGDDNYGLDTDRSTAATYKK